MRRGAEYEERGRDIENNGKARIWADEDRKNEEERGACEGILGERK